MIEKEELKDLLENNTYTQIAEKFSVSDTAVRKWAKKHGIFKRRIQYNGHNSKLIGTGKKKKCTGCDLLIKNANKYCSNKCQRNYEYEKYIHNWKLGLIEGLMGQLNQVSAHIRKYMFDKYHNKCGECGWSEENTFTGTTPLEIDHIDGNYLNNVEDNLQLLCPNCHALTETYKGANRGNGRFERMNRYNEGKSY